ncbi:hypothetical protein [Chitinophaga sp. CF418]|uniref:hypothetical protein n=1 Tax=Chitinophaga sp. CF418 TaxID=1855287 RepID=UPI000921ADC8|nr:hypothetical protein [Chitinophaga sp. CF418]SHN45524.1 hypothetical protein SAMN05216311_12090 [Chitinophaga sp. CF418]
MNLLPSNRILCNSCNRDTGIVPLPAVYKGTIEQPKDVATENSASCFPCKVEVDLTQFSFTVYAQSPHQAKVITDTLLPHMIYAKNQHFLIKNKTEMKKNQQVQSLILLVATGGFWVGLLLGISHILMAFATSHMDWYRFIAVMAGMPLMFTLLGAFLLKTTGGLAEKNFMELVKLTLIMNFSVFKLLKQLKK